MAMTVRAKLHLGIGQCFNLVFAQVPHAGDGAAVVPGIVFADEGGRDKYQRPQPKLLNQRRQVLGQVLVSVVEGDTDRPARFRV